MRWRRANGRDIFDSMRSALSFSGSMRTWGSPASWATASAITSSSTTVPGRRWLEKASRLTRS